MDKGREKDMKTEKGMKRDEREKGKITGRQKERSICFL
jgi:hypothetical protein